MTATVDVDELHGLLMRREITKSFQLLERLSKCLDHLDPAVPGAAHMVRCFAEGVDVGFPSLQRLEGVLARFPKSPSELVDYVDFRMARGIYLHLTGAHNPALEDFRFVSFVTADVPGKNLKCIAQFFIARCLHAIGQYKPAQKAIAEAKKTAVADGLQHAVAVIAITEAWVRLQMSEDAMPLLHEAEAGLSPDDHVARGSLLSCYARIARRAGDYVKAIEHWEQADATYQACGFLHSHLGRVCNNLALTRILVAQRYADTLEEEDQKASRRRELFMIRLRKETDALFNRMASRDARLGQWKDSREVTEFIERLLTLAGVGHLSKRTPEERSALLDQSRSLLVQAEQDLKRADEIYSNPKNHHGLGTTRVYQGLLALDQERWADAEERAQEAVALANEHADHVVLARASLLEFKVNRRKADLEVPEPVDFRRRALRCARAALEQAKQTQNVRLLAKALAGVCEALSGAGASEADLDEARCLLDEAKQKVKPITGDYLWDAIARLEKVLHRPVDMTTWFTDRVNEGAAGRTTLNRARQQFEDLYAVAVLRRLGPAGSVKALMNLLGAGHKMYGVMRRASIQTTRLGGRSGSGNAR